MPHRSLVASAAIAAALSALVPASGEVSAQGAQAGARSQSIAGDAILVGTIDLLAHQGPDDRARPIDFLDLARYAKLKGMRGVVFGSHLDSTVIQAYVARKEVPGFEAFGAIDLNWTQGGMNPAAVEHFAQVSGGYARVVLMASEDTVMRIQADKSDRRPVYVVKDGRVVPEAKAVIATIKKHNLSMATGSPQ